MKKTRRLFAAALAILAAQACSGAQHAAGPHVVSQAPRGAVDGSTIADLQRDLDETPPGDESRHAIRDGVACYMAARGVEAMQTGDFQTAVARLRQALVHYTPEEIAQGGLPDDLAPLARALLEVSSARGDEAHALAAARVLRALRTPDPAAREQWQRITDWGTRNRQEFQRPWVVEGELSDIFKEIARIVPARDVLESAAEHMVARRRAVLDARQNLTGHDGPRLNFDEVQHLRAGMRVAAADLAILFLRVGDVREAANRLTSLGSGSESSGLAAALGAIAQGEGGADPLWELAQRLGPIDGAAAAGVCRVGRQNFPQDTRFAGCLAVAAESERDLGLASAHLERAATVGNADQRALRAAIEASRGSLGLAIGGDDLAPGRRAYERTRTLLARWRAQYQGQLAPVAEVDLETLAADLELSAGNLREAEEHLTRATQGNAPSRDAYYLLAEISWRHRDGAEAARRLRAGLALPLRPDESDSLFRPQYTVRLAQAAQVSGDAAEARRLFEEAATALDALSRSLTAHDLAAAMLQRAVVADALGDSNAVHNSLRAAIDADADSREVAARAITFSLSRGRWADARDFYRTARATLSLDRTWQVYFALWGSVAARMGHLSDDGGALRALESVAAEADGQASWTARLAQRYTGALDRAHLVGYARTTGQRAEALFYEAMLKASAGDAAGSEEDLRAVLAAEVLRFWEYEMSWEMLERHTRPSASAQAPVPRPPTAAR
jgi:hypothetical protein